MTPRAPISISHATRMYRVIFWSLDPRAVLDPDEAPRLLSRWHLLALGKRDYDAGGETPADAVRVARDYLAVDRQIDGTPDAAWHVDDVRAY